MLHAARAREAHQLERRVQVGRDRLFAIDMLPGMDGALPEEPKEIAAARKTAEKLAAERAQAAQEAKAAQAERPAQTAGEGEE